MKDIKGYEGLYAADKSGKIWGYPKHRLKTGRFLKTWLIGHGYEMVMLYKDKNPRKFLVHRLIAQTFIPNPQNLREVNHKDANRLNNCPENLEWVSSKQNKQHAIKLGLYKNLGQNPARGSKSGQAKLTEEAVRIIRHRASNGEIHRVLAREYGVSGTAIDYICKRKTWTHI